MSSNTLTSENRGNQKPVSRGYISPTVNISETKDEYLIEAEMPGVNKDGLEVLVEGNELAIVGRRGADPAGVDTLYRERSQRDYRRTFVLDPLIDTNGIKAKIEQGVLTLTVPKAEIVKPRKIAVSE